MADKPNPLTAITHESSARSHSELGRQPKPNDNSASERSSFRTPESGEDVAQTEDVMQSFITGSAFTNSLFEYNTTASRSLSSQGSTTSRTSVVISSLSIGAASKSRQVSEPRQRAEAMGSITEALLREEILPEAMHHGIPALNVMQYIGFHLVRPAVAELLQQDHLRLKERGCDCEVSLHDPADRKRLDGDIREWFDRYGLSGALQSGLEKAKTARRQRLIDLLPVNPGKGVVTTMEDLLSAILSTTSEDHIWFYDEQVERLDEQILHKKYRLNDEAQRASAEADLKACLPKLNVSAEAIKMGAQTWKGKQAYRPRL